MTYQKCLREASEKLQQVGITDCNSDAWILFEYLTGMTRMQYLMNMNDEVSEEIYHKYMELIELRSTRVPVQHITGWQEFMGLPFHVNEHVLIPRQDTEVLVEETISHLEDGMRVLDMCTGSSCILTSILKLGNKVITGTGVDVSKEALEIARMNLTENQVEAELIQSDLFDAVLGKFDIIVSNPPYIATSEIETLEKEVKTFDPILALDGKEDGLYFYRRIVDESTKYLNDGGFLLFEIGYDQGESVPLLLKNAGYSNIQVKKDLAGLDRVVVAMYNSRG